MKKVIKIKNVIKRKVNESRVRGKVSSILDDALPNILAEIDQLDQAFLDAKPVKEGGTPLQNKVYDAVTGMSVNGKDSFESKFAIKSGKLNDFVFRLSDKDATGILKLIKQRKFESIKELDVRKTHGDKRIENPATGNDIKLRTALKAKKGSAVYAKGIAMYNALKDKPTTEGKGNLDEAKNFYQDVVNMRKAYRMLKREQPKKYKELDTKLRIGTMERGLKSLQDYMDRDMAKNERAYASTDGKPYFDYDPGQGKLTEISAKAGLEDVIMGRTTAIEGIKLSVGLADEIRSWLMVSPYGRRYGQQAMKGNLASILPIMNSYDFGKRLSSKLKREWKTIVSKHIKEGKLTEAKKIKPHGLGYRMNVRRAKADFKKGENIAAVSKQGLGSFKIEDQNDFNKYHPLQWDFAYIVKEGKLTEESAMKAIINAKKGAKASGGGYSSWTKISNNSWKNKKTGRLAHNAGLYDRIGQFSDFVIEGKLNEVRVKKGDAIKMQDGEIGIVNKVKGRVAYIKLDSMPGSFHPIEAARITYKGKHKGKDLYSESKLNEGAKDKFGAPPMNKWWIGSKESLMSAIYHAQRQVPPSNKAAYEKNWKSIVKQLQKKFPAPTAIYRKRLDEDYSQRARNFRVALRRRLEAMKKGKKIKYGKLAWTALGNGNFKDSKGRTVPHQEIVQDLKFAVKGDILQHRGAAGDDMVNAYLKFEGKLTEAKFYVTYNQGRGMGKKVVTSKESDFEDPRVFRNYNDAEKYVKMAKSGGGSPGRITAYWVSDANMNRIDKAGRRI